LVYVLVMIIIWLFVIGVEEIIKDPDRYSIFPNPTNGNFHIGFSDIITSDIEIAVMNMTGQQVFHETIKNSSILTEKNIDLLNLPAGTYVVIIKDNRSISQKKLIIN